MKNNFYTWINIICCLIFSKELVSPYTIFAPTNQAFMKLSGHNLTLFRLGYFFSIYYRLGVQGASRLSSILNFNCCSIAAFFLLKLSNNLKRFLRIYLIFSWIFKKRFQRLILKFWLFINLPWSHAFSKIMTIEICWRQIKNLPRDHVNTSFWKKIG